MMCHWVGEVIHHKGYILWTSLYRSPKVQIYIDGNIIFLSDKTCWKCTWDESMTTGMRRRSRGGCRSGFLLACILSAATLKKREELFSLKKTRLTGWTTVTSLPGTSIRQWSTCPSEPRDTLMTILFYELSFSSVLFFVSVFLCCGITTRYSLALINVSSPYDCTITIYSSIPNSQVLVNLAHKVSVF